VILFAVVEEAKEKEPRTEMAAVLETKTRAERMTKEGMVLMMTVVVFAKTTIYERFGMAEVRREYEIYLHSG
jgi:hypothetical protein